MNKALEVINRAAQGHLDMAEAVDWFARLDAESSDGAMRDLCLATGQSHPLPDEAAEAIRFAGLKPTLTPCVLLRRYRTGDALARIRSLPPNEAIRSFRLLLALFTIADKRRREQQCRGECSHEWHHLDPDWKS